MCEKVRFRDESMFGAFRYRWKIEITVLTYKILHGNVRKAANEVIRDIATDPTIGTEKKQDLRGVYVYKIKIQTQQYLLAYTFDPKTLTLLMIGVHENFYRDLKRRI